MSEPTGGPFLAQNGGLTWPWVEEADGVSTFQLDGQRIAVLEGGTLQVKDGDLNAAWVVQADGVSDFQLDGQRIAVLEGGTLQVKDGDLNAAWVVQADGVSDFQLDGQRIAVLEGGTLQVKDGDLNAAWVVQADGVSDFQLDGQRIAVLEGGTLQVKDGDLNAAWVVQADGVSDFQLDGQRIAVLEGGTLQVKDGDLNAAWVVQADGVSDFQLDGQRIAVLEGGTLQVKDGDLNAAWVVQADGVSDFQLDGQRIAVLEGGTLQVKDGDLNAAWVVQADGVSDFQLDGQRIAVLEGGTLQVKEGNLTINYLAAYPDVFSYFPGDTLRLHIGSTWPYFGVQIYWLTDWDEDNSTWTLGPRLYDSGAPLPCASQQVGPANGTGTTTVSGIEDWLWPANFEVTLPSGAESWTSGIYVAEVAAYATTGTILPPKAATNWVEFVVKNPSPSPEAHILYKLNLTTMQAYNPGVEGPGVNPDAQSPPWANSLYVQPLQSSTEPTPVGYKVTMRRPITSWTHTFKSYIYNYPMIRWLSQQAYAVDYFTDVDLHLDSSLAFVSKYSVVLSVGHDEYWSDDMRSNLEAFRDRGGNVAFLSGNACFWRITFTDVDPTYGVPTAFVCDKAGGASDGSGPDAWWKLDRPENSLTGVSTRNAAIRPDTEYGPFCPATPSSPGYTIQNCDHWVLEGTQLGNGWVVGVDNCTDTSGNPIIENLVGYEADGARLTFDVNGVANPTLKDGTPASFVILGVGLTEPYEWAAQRSNCTGTPDNPCTNWWVFPREDSPPPPQAVSGIYAATMGVYSSYGAVFTGAGIYWSRVLNEWDTGLHSRSIPKLWSPPPAGIGGPAKDPDGYPILGNGYLHRITRNVLDAFQSSGKTVVGLADLDGDNVPDIVLQTDSTGEPCYWLLEGTSRRASGSIVCDGSAAAGRRLRIVGVADLDSDGSPDLVLQNQTDGSLWYWLLRHMKRASYGALAPGYAPGDLTWRVAAVLDLNGDGRPDLLFQNQADGSLRYWLLNGLSTSISAPFAPDYSPGDLTWKLVAALDLDDDGQMDLLFQNQTDGSLRYWLLNGRKRTDAAAFEPSYKPSHAHWRVVGCGDLNGDGKPDILFQNQIDGQLQYWFISKFSRTEVGSLSW